MDDNEYLRLPHGMFDRDEDWLKRERKILELHAKSGEKIDCKLKKYSPIGYESTFIRGAHTAKNKVYTLNSKSGKSLILSSDSTPSVFRNYVVNNNGESQRIAFVAPLFRYRNSHNRHFTQIGYALVNEKHSEDSNLDVNLIQLSKAMVDLFASAGIKTKIHINDYRALKKVLGRYLPEEKISDLLHKLQFSSANDRKELLKDIITDGNESIIELLNQKPIIIPSKKSNGNPLNLPEEYIDIYRMADGIRYMTGVEVYFDPADLHSIETIDNYALRFRTLDGVALGDGGEYSKYAHRWNDKIKNFWSVASGVEAIERNSPSLNLDEIKRKIAVCNIDASDEFLLQALKTLEEQGECVAYKGTVANIKKALKKLQKNYTHIVILGKNEENGEDIKIKSFSTGEITSIESPRKKRIVDKSNIEFEER